MGVIGKKNIILVLICSAFFALPVLAAPLVTINSYQTKNGGTLINATASGLANNQGVSVAYEVFPKGSNKAAFVIGNSRVKYNGRFTFFAANLLLRNGYALRAKIFNLNDSEKPYCFETLRDIDRDELYPSPKAIIEDAKISKADGSLQISASLYPGNKADSFVEYCFDLTIKKADGQKIEPVNGYFSSRTEILPNKKIVSFSPKGIYLDKGDKACVKIYARQTGTNIFSSPYFCFPDLPYVQTFIPSNITEKTVDLNGRVNSFWGAKQLYAGFAIYDSKKFYEASHENIPTGQFGMFGKEINFTAHHEPWVDWATIDEDSFIWLDKPLNQGRNVSFKKTIDSKSFLPLDDYENITYAACASPTKDPKDKVCGEIVTERVRGLEEIDVINLPPKMLADGTILPQGHITNTGKFPMLRTFFTWYSFDYRNQSVFSAEKTAYRELDTTASALDMEPLSPIKPTQGEARFCYRACITPLLNEVPDTYLVCAKEDYCFTISDIKSPIVRNLALKYQGGGYPGYKIDGVVDNWKEFNRLYLGYEYYNSANPADKAVAFENSSILKNTASTGDIKVWLGFANIKTNNRDGKFKLRLCAKQYWEDEKYYCANDWLSLTTKIVPIVETLSAEAKTAVHFDGSKAISLTGQVKNLDEYPEVYGGFAIWSAAAGEAGGVEYIWDDTVTLPLDYRSKAEKYWFEINIAKLKAQPADMKYGYRACVKDEMRQIFCDEKSYVFDASKLLLPINNCTAPVKSLFWSSDSTQPYKSENEKKVLYYDYSPSAGNIRLHWALSAIGKDGIIEIIDDCRKMKISVRKDSCNGLELASCDLGDIAFCQVSYEFARMEQPQTHYWCLDRNFDGKFDGQDESGVVATINFRSSENKDDLDWRNKDGKNWLTSVKDQDGIGNCWAYAYCGSIESRYKIEQKDASKNLDLSEIWLYSADKFPLPDGVSIAPYQTTKEWALMGNGIVDEACMPGEKYPYGEAIAKAQCADWQTRGTKATPLFVSPDLSSSKATTEYMMKVLDQRGPFVGKIWAGFRIGNDGVMECDSAQGVNHGVIVVGYNKKDRYWIIKNSWGTTWGDNGYGKLRFDNCNITLYAPDEFIGIRPPVR